MHSRSSVLVRRSLLQSLELLCSADTGLEPIAPAAAILARDIIGAQSTSIFWLDRTGQPAGFFHDCAPAELKDLFVTRFDELFSRPGEPNMVTLTQTDGPAIGKMLVPDAIAAATRSNVWRYLCAPLGHHYCLDIRIERNGQGTAIMCLWNPPDRPFGAEDVAAAEPVRQMLDRAAASTGTNAQWQPASPPAAHLVTSADGQQLLAIDTAAEAMLTRSHMLRQNIPLTSAIRTAPLFCRQLAAQLDAGQHARLELPCADGRFVLAASRSRRIGSDDAAEMIITLTLEQPRMVGAIAWIESLPLTFLQKRIVLFALQGGKRSDSQRRFAISTEALKKHLKAIYEVTDCADWDALSHAYRPQDDQTGQSAR